MLLAGGSAPGADGPAYLVKNINAGPDPQAGSWAHGFADIGSAVLFIASDEARGQRLWRTDGTAAGTHIVSDIAVVDNDLASAGPPVVLDGTYYFPGPDGLYRSDGTAAGTFRIADASGQPVAAIGDSIYVREWEAPVGDADEDTWQLWKISPTGSVLLGQFDDGEEDPDFASIGATLFFIASQGGGRKLWVSDGTLAGTHRVADIAPGEQSAFPGSSRDDAPGLLFPVGGILYFAATDGATGLELWRSDGTAAGTVQVKDINPGAGDGIVLTENWNQPMFAALDGHLYFVATDGSSGTQLWVTDGTKKGTQLVTSLSLNLGYLAAPAIVSAKGHIFFPSCDETHGYQLWSTDGTAAGTALVKADIATGPCTSLGPFVALGDVLLFATPEGLWRSDGTAAGTMLLKSVTVDGLTATAHGAYLDADDGKIGMEPWFSDGTTAGTAPLGNLVVGDAASNPHDLTDLSGTLVFGADDGVHGDELWRSDATAGGTTLVADINPGEPASAPSNLVVAGGRLYFVADDGQHGRELWRSDGTPAGTALVRDINPGPADSNPQQLLAVDDAVYFFADDGAHGLELWKSDGSADGTAMIKDINPGPNGSFACQWGCGAPVRWRNMVFFAADDGATGAELWRTDGTEEGTQLVSDLIPGINGSFPTMLAALDAGLVFRTNPEIGVGWPALWRSDGTPQGTVQLEPLLGIGGDAPAIIGNELFDFFFVRRIGQPELWRSDGTPDGTFVLERPTLHPGELASASGVLFDLFGANDEPASLYTGCGLLGHFSYDDSYDGVATVADRMLVGRLRLSDGTMELWTSDGTPTGTTLLQEFPSQRGVNQQPLAIASGANIFLSAWHPQANRELWALPIAAVPPVDPNACPITVIEPSVQPTPQETPGAAVIQLGSASGVAGQRVTFTATLHAAADAIAGLQHDAQFDPNTPVAADDSGQPDCTVNPAIAKPATAFSFLPPGCTPGQDCTGYRVLVLALDNVIAIPPDAALYTCTVDIATNAPVGAYPIVVSNAGAADSAGHESALTGIDGSIRVIDPSGARGDAALPSLTNASAGSGCAIGNGAPSRVSSLVLVLPIALIAYRKRRRPATGS